MRLRSKVSSTISNLTNIPSPYPAFSHYHQILTGSSHPLPPLPSIMMIICRALLRPPHCFRTINITLSLHTEKNSPIAAYHHIAARPPATNCSMHLVSLIRTDLNVQQPHQAPTNSAARSIASKPIPFFSLPRTNSSFLRNRNSTQTVQPNQAKLTQRVQPARGKKPINRGRRA